MSIQVLAKGKYIHWGAYCSLYSGKTRSYLLKKGIAHIEVNPSHSHYLEAVLPRLGFFSVPVLETPDGEIIQDSTDIILYLEERHPEQSIFPEDKTLRALAWLIHNYGSEGLLASAMHYRWNYKEANYDFVIDEFTRNLIHPEQRKDKAAAKVQAMAFADGMDAYLEKLGVVNEQTRQAIEQSTEKLFALLDEHFRAHPYLLGGLPSIADFGMMAGLFAHLSRDPHSSQLMKRQAPALYRWTETMNRPGVLDSELWHVAPEFFGAEQLPETLLKVLELICADYGAELVATFTTYDCWLDAGPTRPAGSLVSTNSDRSIRQALGEMSYINQGVTFTRAAWPDGIMGHGRVLGVVEEMSMEERENYKALLSRVGGGSMASLTLQRPLTRSDCQLVLT
jgi:glutathione S-transferase